MAETDITTHGLKSVESILWQEQYKPNKYQTCLLCNRPHFNHRLQFFSKTFLEAFPAAGKKRKKRSKEINCGRLVVVVEGRPLQCISRRLSLFIEGMREGGGREVGRGSYRGRGELQPPRPVMPLLPLVPPLTPCSAATFSSSVVLNTSAFKFFANYFLVWWGLYFSGWEIASGLLSEGVSGHSIAVPLLIQNTRNTTGGHQRQLAPCCLSEGLRLKLCKSEPAPGAKGGKKEVTEQACSWRQRKGQTLHPDKEAKAFDEEKRMLATCGREWSLQLQLECGLLLAPLCLTGKLHFA